MARDTGGVSASRRVIPRGSAMVTAGQGPGAAGSRVAAPLSQRHHVSALGVADVKTTLSASREPRSRITSRE